MRLSAVLLLFLPLAGCDMPDFISAPAQLRGNRVEADQLKQLVPGTSTRADATALLGTPTAKATFDDNTWIYISAMTRPVIAGTTDVMEQQVVVLSFDQSGVLRGVSRKTDDDSRPVGMVARATPSPGSEASFLIQLLGNVGRFGGGTLPTGGSPNRSSSGNY